MKRLKEHGIVAVVSMSEDWEIAEQDWPSNMFQRAALEWYALWAYVPFSRAHRWAAPTMHRTGGRWVFNHCAWQQAASPDARLLCPDALRPPFSRFLPRQVFVAVSSFPQGPLSCL